MKKTSSIVSKSLSILLTLAMVLSLVTIPVSAAAVDLSQFADMDQSMILGQSYAVDEEISLAEAASHTIHMSLTYEVADDAEIVFNLVRDEAHPYVDASLFPHQKMSGELSDWETTKSGVKLFSNIDYTVSSDTSLVVSFDSNCYFYGRNGMPDPSAPHSRGGTYLDVCGYFNLEASVDGTVVASAPIKIVPYHAFHTMDEIYVQTQEVVETALSNGLYASYEIMGHSTAGRDMPYMIIADTEASVAAWLNFTELAETDPSAVLAGIEAGEYDDIRVPVLFSNVHSNEAAAADGILEFAWMLANAGSDGILHYDKLTGFTAAGEAELAAELGPVGEEGSVAIPDLIADKASYLGYLTVDNHGKSGPVDLDTYYTSETEALPVFELLEDVFFILVPEENVDGRTYMTRESSNGYDLNRDNSFQTTSETASMQALIGKFNPVSFAEFHGRVQAFQCEPCDPPHEPNFEYDLLAEHLIPGGEALGIAAVANNSGYNSYVIPQRDYLMYTGNGDETYWADPWDDMSTSYTPQFAMLHGTVAYTVELPAYSDDTAQAVQYGILGNAAYVGAEKLGYLTAQTKIYERGVTNYNSDAFEEVGQWLCDQYDVEGAEMDVFRPEFNGKNQNGNFYPECYIIPMNASKQSNLQAAAEMMEWLTRNNVKVNLTTSSFKYNGVTYPAGTMIVSMYQAKRSVANGALYDGTLIKGWTILYSEGITTFNETRGFDMITVAEPSAYKTISAVCGPDMDYTDACSFLLNVASSFTGPTGADVIISNASVASTAAVNELLQAGKTVGLVTKGIYKGDFICSYEDYRDVADDYILTAAGVYGANIQATIIDGAPTVYLTGVPANTSSSGFAYVSQVSGSYNWNYDRIAMEAMNFNVTADVSAADVVVGASALSGESLEAMQNGMPYIGYGSSAAAPIADLVGFTRTGLQGAMDCLAYVTYPDENLINASYVADKDDVMYGYGQSLGYFSSIPAGAATLVKVDGSKEPTEGFIPTITETQQASYDAFLNDGILGFSYQEDGLNIALFANSLTHKGHQKDEYGFISNFIFSSCLSGDPYNGTKASSGSSSKPSGGSAETAPEVPEQPAVSFKDVSPEAYYYDALVWATQNNIVEGVDDTHFAPTAACTRAQVVTFLWRAMGCPEPAGSSSFSDVASGAYYAKAVAWAAENGITIGNANGDFAPNAAVSRAQFVTFLFRCIGTNTTNAKNNPFSDVAENTYYTEAVLWAAENGVTTGTTASTFSPSANCNRAQVITFLNRALTK